MIWHNAVLRPPESSHQNTPPLGVYPHVERGGEGVGVAGLMLMGRIRSCALFLICRVRHSFHSTKIVTSLAFIEEIYNILSLAKVHKKSDFLRPVYKKVKTVTIFVGKKRSAGFPSLIER